MAAHDTVESVPTIAWNRCPSSVECAAMRPLMHRMAAINRAAAAAAG